MTLVASHSPDRSTPLRRSSAVERIRERIIAGWRLGACVRVEDFAEEMFAAGATEDDWHELILTEIRARRDRGDTPNESEYAGRFPQHAARLREFFDEAMTCQMPPSGGVAPPIVSAFTQPIRVSGYDLYEVLGRGGMGVVYKARHIKLNRIVALKMVLAGRHASAEDLTRFAREAEAVAALSHPNIVQVYEVGEHDGTPYFSLEYVEGGTLANRLRNGAIPAAEAARIAQGVARGAHAAHEHDIVHRDLKPANILLANASVGTRNIEDKATLPAFRTTTSVTRVPKLTDFGIAKRLNDARGLTATGIAAGTPQYMAPEQALADAAHPVGPTADVYSIGAVLFEMLTGNPPFDGDNPVEVMKRVISDAPPPPSRLKPGVPRELETICLKCLEKERQRRYPTAAALADDLGRWLAGEAITARPIGPVDQAWRWCRRNRAVAALLAGIMITLVAGATVAGVLAVRANQFANEADRNAAESRANADAAAKNAAEAERQATEARNHAAEAKVNEERANEARGEEERLRQEADDRERRRVRELYAAHMAVGFDAWESGHVANTRKLLEKYRPAKPGAPDARGFEWYYLARLIRPFEATLNAQYRVSGPAAVPGTNRWAMGSRNGVLFWEPAANRTWSITLGLSEDVTKIAFSRDGKIMACTSWRPHLYLHDLSANRALHTIRLDDKMEFRAFGVVFAPDGKTVYAAVGSDTFIGVAGKLIAYDVATGREVKRFDGIRGTLRALALSADGKKLAAGGQTGAFHIWDVESGKEIRRFEPPVSVCSVGLNIDGSLVAAGTALGTIGVWEVATGRLLRSMRGHVDWVEHLAFAPDGTRFATAAAEGVIRLWDTATGEELRAYRGHEKRITGLAFSDRGTQLLSTGEDGSALVWDAHRDPAVTSQQLAYPQGDAVLPLPDDRRVVVVNNWCGYQILDLRSGELSAEVKTTNPQDNAHDAALSPDGNTLAIGTYRSGVQLVSLADPAAGAKPLKDAGDASLVAFSPDGKWLATGNFKGKVVAHSMAGEHSPRSLGNLRYPIQSVTFDPTNSSHVLATCLDGTIRLWNHEDGEELLTIDIRDHRPGHVAFSADGKRFATAGGDSTARIWDAKTGRLVRKFEGHTQGVECVGFSRDGSRLVTGSHDLTVKVWDVETGLPTLTLRGHTRPVRRAAFDRDGAALVTVGGPHVKLWDGHAALVSEQGRLLAMGTRVRRPTAEWAAATGVRGTFRLVNESGLPLIVLPTAKSGKSMRVYIAIERLGNDPTIPKMGVARPDERDQYRLGTVLFMPPEGTMQAVSYAEGKFAFATPSWPPGKYRLHFEHGWPMDRTFNSLETCDFVIPD